MSKPSIEPEQPTRLRHTAEARLKGGTAPPMKGWATGIEALTLLHRLASNAASSEDALKLLHELQVHQVELDMQHEQMRESRRELDDDLDHYVELFDCAPIGNACVDLEGGIIEANLAAAGLFGSLRDEMRGRPLCSLLDSASRPALQELLKRLRLSGSKETCAVQSGGDAGAPRRLQVVASLAPDGHFILMSFIEPADCKDTEHPA